MPSTQDHKNWPARLYALDVSRGFAAMSVILWHWQHFYFSGVTINPDFDRSSQPFYFLLKIFYEKGAAGVYYFFLLSGFIFFWLYKDSIKNRIVSFKLFWIQRFSRLYPLHFVTLLLVALLQAIYSSQQGDYFIYPFNDAYHFILNLGFASTWGMEQGFSFNAPIWSVSIEILLYFLFFILVFKQLGGLFLCLIISILSLLLNQLTDEVLFKAASLFFLGGFIYHLTYIISIHYLHLTKLIYSITVLLWTLTIIHFYLFDFRPWILMQADIGLFFLSNFPYYLLFPFTVCSLALYEINKGEFLKSISWIGNITYSSYLLHFPLQLVFALMAAYQLISSNFYLSPFFLIVFFAVLILVSYSTFIHFEMPMQKKIRDYASSKASA